MRLITVLVILLAAREVQAYPELQFVYGRTCTYCHERQWGDLLLSEDGRDMWTYRGTWEGDGRLFHGPSPFDYQIGGALTLGAGLHDHEVATDGFAMVPRAEIALHTASRTGIGLGYTIGYYGAAGPAFRGFFLQYEQDAGGYVRAGRFGLVYGLRPADPTAYVRRYLGMGLAEEPYGIGFGGTYLDGEIHIAGFGGGPADDIGLAFYWERHPRGNAYALQARVTGSDNDQQTWLGGVYKHWLPERNVMVMAELDLGVKQFRDGTEMLDVPAAFQLVGHAGIHHVGDRGVTVGATVQAYDPDLALEGTSRASVGAEARWTPRAHWELLLAGKAEAAGLDVDHPDLIAQAILQYFL